jgi:phosphoribosyl 1,2-cyclic phosphate phosphodiesterase
LRIRFLGTGTSQGVPVIGCQCKVCRSEDAHDNRLRSSILLETQNKSIVIDTGPDFRQQMLLSKQMKLDAVLYTHEHRDHISGMDELRSFNFMTKKRINLFGEKNVKKALVGAFPYAFKKSDYPGSPQVDFHIIDTYPFRVGEVEITPIRVMHHLLPILGFRIGDFTYITDAKYIPDSEKAKIFGSKIIVLNALRKQSHISHFSLTEALNQIREFSPKSAYLTHISHQLGLSSEIEKELPENVFLAYDGLELML